MKVDTEKLIELNSQGLSLRKVGAKLGISGERVRQILLEMSLTQPPKQKTERKLNPLFPKRLDLPMGEIKELYLIYHWSVRRIANKYDVSESAIDYRLRELGVRLRDTWTHHYLK